MRARWTKETIYSTMDILQIGKRATGGEVERAKRQGLKGEQHTLFPPGGELGEQGKRSATKGIRQKG